MSSAGGDPRFQELRPSQHVVSSRLGDAGVLVHLKTNQIFELNTTGIRTWELIGEGLGLDAVIEALGSEFSADPDLVRHEVTDLVLALTREGLLDVGGGG
ncbi:MAG: PqqD family protein [Vicinamibacteria bacterium]|nr:PqqD family protein [Vicinamibacteria bacterium]